MKIRALFLFFFILTGCNGWDAKAPEPTQANEPIVQVSSSYAHVPISVNISDVKAALIREQGGKPLFKGKSPEISAKLLIDKSFPALMEDVIVTPFKASGCLTERVLGNCVKNVPKRVLENCLKKFKLDKCFKTVTVPVQYQCYKDVKKCWPEVKEVVASKIKVQAYIKEQLLPTSVWFNYDGQLRDVDIEAIGQSISVRADIRASVSVDIKHGILDASTKIKGALKCKSDISVSATTKIALHEDASISHEITKFDLGLDRLCIPGAVEIADLAMLDMNQFLHKELMKKLLHKPVVDLINKQLQKAGADQIAFREQLNKIAVSLEAPLDLQGGFWLAVNPRRILASQLNGLVKGNKNKIELNVAFEAEPKVVFGPHPGPQNQDASLEFATVDDLPRGIHLVAKGSLVLESARNEILLQITSYLDSYHADKSYTVSDAELYQSGNKFVIGVVIAKRSDNEKLGKLYLWATPYLDSGAGEIRLRNVDFDIESKNVIPKAAAWLLSETVTKLIEDKVRFSYGGELKKLQSSVSNLEEDVGSGLLKGKIDDISVNQIWIGDSSINVLAEARGSASFQLKP